MQHYILNSSNQALNLNGLFGLADPVNTMSGLPLGTDDGTSDGEVGVKVIGLSGFGAGGGGGSEDLLYTDDSGTFFIYRDNGATPPVFTAYSVPAGTAYTPSTNPHPYAPATGATAAKQDTGNTTLAEIATDTDKLDANLSTLATQVTLAAVLAKITSDPATQTTLAAVLAKISSDPATQTTLAAVLAKLSSDPATQATLAAVLAKLSSDPATQTTLAEILAKIISNPATDTLQTSANTKLDTLHTDVGLLAKLTDTQPVSAASLPLPSGASTSAKQPAPGTQATPSADIITVIPPRPSLFTNIGANATLNVKGSAGNVLAVSCHNANAAVRYLQLHNTATVPAGAAVPIYSFVVFSGGQTIIGTDFFTNAGINFSTGIAFAFSTTRDTYTAGSAGDQSTVVHYI